MPCWVSSSVCMVVRGHGRNAESPEGCQTGQEHINGDQLHSVARGSVLLCMTNQVAVHTWLLNYAACWHVDISSTIDSCLAAAAYSVQGCPRSSAGARKPACGFLKGSSPSQGMTEGEAL